MSARASVLSVLCLVTILSRPYAVCGADLAPRVVDVTGVGEIVAEPDYGILHLGIESDELELRLAREDNDKRAAAVLKAIRGFGIDPKDVRTSQVTVYIDVHRDWQRPELKPVTSYVCRKGFRVIVRDFGNLEKVLNGLLDAGVNRVESVEFDTTRRDALLAEAQELAAKSARTRGQALARGFGQTLGEPQRISASRYELQDQYGANGGRTSRNDPTIAGGQLYIIVTVNVEYRLIDDKAVSKPTPEQR